MNRLKIFVSSYACEPNLGSEIGVGWHWVLEMNKYFELWVLTRKSNQQHIEVWMKQNPQEHEIHWLYYDTPYWMRFWKKGLRGVRMYYLLWQQMSDSIVRKTMERENIEIFHLLTYGNALWRISPSGQKKFFVWGPTGGVDSIPEEYCQHYSKLWQRTEWKRRMMVKALPYNPTFKKQCKNANLILCKSYSIYDNIPEKYRHKAVLFTDVAVEPQAVERFFPHTYKDGITRFIMVGRLEAWRGFDLAIEAMAIAVKENSKLHLDILGKGTEKEQILQHIKQNDMEQYVTMCGQVTMDEYYQKMADCDCVLNPCLKEGAVTTAFDSMSFSKPLVCIDTGGYTRYFDNDCAIVIPREGREEVIRNLANAILCMIDPAERKRLGDEAHKRGLGYTWAEKGKSIYETITKAYREYKTSQH